MQETEYKETESVKPDVTELNAKPTNAKGLGQSSTNDADESAKPVFSAFRPEPAVGKSEIDLEAIKLKQDFTALVAVKKEQLQIPVGKVNKQVWFNISPHPEHQVKVALLEIKDTKDVYVVHPSLCFELQNEWTAKRLVLCQTKQGDYFWWAIKFPDENGKTDSWNESAAEIVASYAGKWVRIMSNTALGQYDVLVPQNDYPAPKWTDESLSTLVGKTFKGKVIDSIDHPVVQKLRKI